MKRRTLALVALALIAGAVSAVALRPAACQATTIKNKTLYNVRIPAGTHNVVYDHVVFKSRGQSGDTSGVLTVARQCHDITFRNCTFATGKSNGVKIIDRGGTIRNISFIGCRIRSQPRMAFECISRGSTTASFKNIRLVNCVIDPSRQQAIRFSGPNVAANCLIDRCTIRGAGNSADPKSGYAVQIDGPLSMTVRDTRIYASRWGAFDLSAPAGIADCGWTFKNNTVDFTRLFQKYGTDGSLARLTRISGMNGSVWTNCTFTTGNAANHVFNAGDWRDCSHNDLSSSTIAGVIASGQDYWSLDASCQNNVMPRVQTLTISALSQTSARVGATLTITGSGFGASQGSSTVSFGEPVNALGFAPCTKPAASYVSWSDTSIVVTVPSMSPGKSGVPGTYHPVYVTVGGVASNRYDFFMTPAATNPAASVFNTSTKTTEQVVYTGWTTETTYSTSYYLGNYFDNGTHDILFDSCTFTATGTGGTGSLEGFNSGIVTAGIMGESVYNITFVNCVFVNNMGSGGEGINAVKIWKNANSAVIRDYTLAGCSIGTPGSTGGSFRRMGIECCEADWVTGNWLTDVRISDCTFEPVGAEPISFSTRPVAGHMSSYLIDDCLIKGFSDLDSPLYFGAIECYSQGLEVRDTEIWAGNGPVFNFQGIGTGTRTYHFFKNVDVDYTHWYQKERGIGGHRLFMVDHYSYSRWEDCTFNTGTAAQYHCLYNLGDSSWAGNTYNDFTNSTISGVIIAFPGSGGQPGKPATTADGFDSVSSSNTLPTWVP